MRRFLTDTQLHALQDVGFFHYFTADQLMRLRYGKSHNYVRDLLRDLWDPHHDPLKPGRDGYLYRQAIHKKEHHPTAKAEYVYWLSPKGARAVRESGQPVPKLTKRKDLTGVQIPHTLAVNEFFIAAQLLAEAFPELVSIRHWDSERYLRAVPFVTDVGVTSSDGFVWITCQGKDYPILLEVDRGSEAFDKWQEKVRVLTRFVEEGYQKRYGTELVTIAVVVSMADEDEALKRRNELLGWIERTLQKDGNILPTSLPGEPLLKSDLFQLSCVPPSSTVPRRYFGGAHWVVPLRPGERHALLV
jgi:hypothetical protein